MPTPEQAIAEVERVYTAALVDGAGVNHDNALKATRQGPATISKPWFMSSEESAAFSNLLALWGNVDKWRTTYKAWATAARRDNGSAYSWEEWSRYGRELADAAAVHADTKVNAGVIAVVSKATAATAATVSKPLVAAATAAAKSIEQGWGIPVVLGVAGLIAAAYVYRTFKMAGA